MNMDALVRKALGALREHWGASYEIGLTGSIWWASRRTDPNRVLEEATEAQLLQAIRKDFLREKAGVI